MKGTVLAGAVALIAMSAIAADQQSVNVPEQTLTPTVVKVQGDSPLVAAAKRTGRLGKKPTAVITNETLMKSGGHFTTTVSQDPVPTAKVSVAVAVNPTPQYRPETKKADKAKASKDAAANHALADYEGASTENVIDDPAAQEGAIRAAAGSNMTATAPTTAPAPAAAPKAAEPPPPPRKP